VRPRARDAPPHATARSAASAADVQANILAKSRYCSIQALARSNFGVAFMPVSIARAAGLRFVHTEDVPTCRQATKLLLEDEDCEIRVEDRVAL